MARKGPKNSRDRQDRLAEVRRAQESAGRRRNLLIAGGVTVVVLALVGSVIFGIRAERRNSDPTRVGASAAAADCDPVVTDPAGGNNVHVGPGTDRPEERIEYATVPPSSGEHYAEAVEPALPFYTAENRPPLESLVHNLEHGYTNLWYAPSTPQAQVDQLRRIGDLARRDPATNGKFIVSAWDPERGALPEGKTVALSHWGVKNGYRQFCAQPSGEAVTSFVARYPSTDSPEPNA